MTTWASGGDPLTDEDESPFAAANRAWVAGCGSRLSAWDRKFLVDGGVTVERIDRITAVARAVLGVTEIETPTEEPPERPLAWPLKTPVHMLAWQMAANGRSMWGWTYRDVWTDDEVFAWLEMFAGHPEIRASGAWHEARVLVPLLVNWHLKMGRLGLLAYAAGLTFDEALERHAAGTLDAGELVTLASLIGWRLPALP